MLTPSELGYFCVGFIFYLGAVIHVLFYICIDLSLYYILRVLSLIGQLAFTDAGNTSRIKVVRTEGRVWPNADTEGSFSEWGRPQFVACTVFRDKKSE